MFVVGPAVAAGGGTAVQNETGPSAQYSNQMNELSLSFAWSEWSSQVRAAIIALTDRGGQIALQTASRVHCTMRRNNGNNTKY